MASPFDVLGIDPDADDEAVERAYRRRVKEAHPDHGGSARAFQRVRAAYEAVLDGDASDADAVAPDPGPSEAVDRRPEPQVEFLNYEVLDDHGWRLDDEDLFEKAADAGLSEPDHGQFPLDPDEPLLETAERCGFTWPYACRGGACANCAVAVESGDLSMTVDHVLPPDLIDRGIRLSCVGAPATEDLRVVYNVKHLPDLDDLRLPPGPFARARGDG
ncbi:MAG: ferredoxin Fer [Haloferacaceae archaeon]